MGFEYDPAKSQANFTKHGINFEEVQELWLAPHVIFPAKQEYENRFALIGEYKGKIFTCIYTLREDKVRIISCRRARKKEIQLYEENI